MATTPSAGPNARAANAHDHPAPRTSGGTSQIDAIVSANPTHVCVVRAVPTYAGGESSVIAVENWAESAMIVIPQTLASASVTSGGPPSVNPVTAAPGGRGAPHHPPPLRRPPPAARRHPPRAAPAAAGAHPGPGGAPGVAPGVPPPAHHPVRRSEEDPAPPPLGREQDPAAPGGAN